MSNAETIFSVVTSGSPIQPERWQYTSAELDEVVKLCHAKKRLMSKHCVAENLKALGAKDCTKDKPVATKPEPKVEVEKKPAEKKKEEVEKKPTEEKKKEATVHEKKKEVVISEKKPTRATRRPKKEAKA